MQIFLVVHFISELKKYFYGAGWPCKALANTHVTQTGGYPTGRNVPKYSNLTDAYMQHLFTFTHWPNIPRRPWIITSKHNNTTQVTKLEPKLGEYRWTNSKTTLRISFQICPLFTSCTTLAKNPFLSSLPLLINGKVGEKRGTKASDREGQQRRILITSSTYTSL